MPKKYYSTMRELTQLTSAEPRTILSIARRLRLKLIKPERTWLFTDNQVSKIKEALPIYRKLHKKIKKTTSTVKLTPGNLRYMQEQTWGKVARNTGHFLGKFAPAGEDPLIFSATCQSCGLSLTLKAINRELSGPAAEMRCTSKPGA